MLMQPQAEWKTVCPTRACLSLNMDYRHFHIRNLFRDGRKNHYHKPPSTVGRAGSPGYPTRPFLRTNMYQTFTIVDYSISATAKYLIVSCVYKLDQTNGGHACAPCLFFCDDEFRVLFLTCCRTGRLFYWKRICRILKLFA